MGNAIALASVIGPFYLIVGLSMLLHIKSWQKVIKMHRESHFSLVLLFLIEATLGLTIISLYNTWDLSVWLIVTLTGWGMLLEGGAYLLLGKKWADGWLGIWRNNWVMYLFAVIFLVLGVTLSYYAYIN